MDRADCHVGRGENARAKSLAIIKLRRSAQGFLSGLTQFDTTAADSAADPETRAPCDTCEPKESNSDDTAVHEGMLRSESTGRIRLWPRGANSNDEFRQPVMDDHEDEPFKLEALIAEFASQLQCTLAQLLKQKIGIPEPEPIANRHVQVQTGDGQIEARDPPETDQVPAFSPGTLAEAARKVKIEPSPSPAMVSWVDPLQDDPLLGQADFMEQSVTQLYVPPWPPSGADTDPGSGFDDLETNGSGSLGDPGRAILAASDVWHSAGTSEIIDLFADISEGKIDGTSEGNSAKKDIPSKVEV